MTALYESRPDKHPIVSIEDGPRRAGGGTSIGERPAAIFPRQQANVAARLTAPIRSLRVQKGDGLKAGRVLAELEDRDLVVQRGEAAAAAADAEASLQKVVPGVMPTDIERARAEAASAEAAVHQAQKPCDRRRELFARGAVPGRDLLAGGTRLSQAGAAYEVAKKPPDLLMNQMREQDIRIARSRLDQTRARLEPLNARLQFTKIRRQFDGTIVGQFMHPGEMAKPDAPIFTVIDLSVAGARAQVPEDLAVALRGGRECTFTPADSPGTEYRDKSSVVNQAAAPVRRTVEAWCGISDAAAGLRAGVFGGAGFLVETPPGGVLVPLAAAAGIFLAHRFYVADPSLPARFTARFRGLYTTVFNKYYVDQLYDALFVNRTKDLGNACFFIDAQFVDGAVNGTAAGTRGTATVSRLFDSYVVDGLVNLVGWINLRLHALAASLQTGMVQRYALGAVFGIIVLVIVFYGEIVGP